MRHKKILSQICHNWGCLRGAGVRHWDRPGNVFFNRLSPFPCTQLLFFRKKSRKKVLFPLIFLIQIVITFILLRIFLKPKQFFLVTVFFFLRSFWNVSWYFYSDFLWKVKTWSKNANWYFTRTTGLEGAIQNVRDQRVEPPCEEREGQSSQKERWSLPDIKTSVTILTLILIFTRYLPYHLREPTPQFFSKLEFFFLKIF